MKDAESYYLNKIKYKSHNKDKMVESGLTAMRTLKYYKKIDGPSMFQDELDQEKPPWQFLHDQILAT